MLLVIGRSNGQSSRNKRSLRGVLPFNQQGSVNQRGHNQNVLSHNSLERGRVNVESTINSRNSRQERRHNGEVPLDIGSIAAAGERCIDKVVMVEETEYDDVVSCKHSYSEKCHTTYTTDFAPQQEEECEETFVKNCFIEFKKVASQESVQFCHTPIVLEGGGPEVCQTVYESSCATRYEQHEVTDDVAECETTQEEKCVDVTQGYTTEQKCTKWPVQKCRTSTDNVKKYSPQTKCIKVPRKVCGPGTQQVPGAEECFEKQETVIQEVISVKIHDE